MAFISTQRIWFDKRHEWEELGMRELCASTPGERCWLAVEIIIQKLLMQTHLFTVLHKTKVFSSMAVNSALFISYLNI